MKKFLKILAGAWITGAVMGGGCFCGALATGAIVARKGPTDSERFIEAQIEEIQATLEAMQRPTAYDVVAARGGFDEMAGLE